MNITQNTPEWHALRKNKIGASDSAAILGISPWKTPRQLWQEKLDIISSPGTNFAMQRGHDLEPIARQWFEENYEISVPAAVVFHPEYEWMMASLDGINEENKVIVEIKCGGLKLHHLAASGEIPDYYRCQIQHQLAVTGYNKAFYVSYCNDTGYVVIVKRDDAFIDDVLIPALQDFWECLRTFTEPPLQQGDFEEVDTLEWNSLAIEWIHTCDEVKRLTEYQQELKKN